MTPEKASVLADELLRDLLAAAYKAGANDVHMHLSGKEVEREADFTEAASDYASFAMEANDLTALRASPGIDRASGDAVEWAFVSGWNQAAIHLSPGSGFHEAERCEALAEHVAALRTPTVTEESALTACPDCAEPCVVVQLVDEFRRLPLHGDAGCDKLTDDEWLLVARAAIRALSTPPGTTGEDSGEASDA